MAEINAFDRQLSDFIWMATTYLRAGYSLQQIFEHLATEAPQPTATACSRLLADLNNGMVLSEALVNWEKNNPSAFLPEIVATMLRQRSEGGNLAYMLEPMGEAIFQKVGSDKAFQPVMESLAENVRAALPDRS